MAVARDVASRLLRQWQGVHDWAPGGLVNAPGAGAVLADTGPLSAGAYLFHVFGWSDTGMTYQIEHRDAANTGTVVAFNGVAKTMIFPIAANGKDEFVWGNKETLADQERLRVVLAAGSAAPANCMFGIFFQEVADTQSADA